MIPKVNFVLLRTTVFLTVLTFTNGYDNQTVQQSSSSNNASDVRSSYESNLSNTTSASLVDDTINVVKWINEIEDPVLRKWVIIGATSLLVLVIIIVVASVIRGQLIRKRKDEQRKALLRESFASDVFYVDDVLENTPEDKFRL